MIKTGTGILLLWKQQIGLILRDNRPEILAPNTWAMPGGKKELGETLYEAGARELLEELSISPSIVLVGVTERGNGIGFSVLTDQARDKIDRKEGQGFRFFRHEMLNGLQLGGEFKILLEKHPDRVRLMMLAQTAPCPHELGLEKWKGQ